MCLGDSLEGRRGGRGGRRLPVGDLPLDPDDNE